MKDGNERSKNLDHSGCTNSQNSEKQQAIKHKLSEQINFSNGQKKLSSDNNRTLMSRLMKAKNEDSHPDMEEIKETLLQPLTTDIERDEHTNPNQQVRVPLAQQIDIDDENFLANIEIDIEEQPPPKPPKQKKAKKKGKKESVESQKAEVATEKPITEEPAKKGKKKKKQKSKSSDSQQTSSGEQQANLEENLETAAASSSSSDPNFKCEVILRKIVTKKKLNPPPEAKLFNDFRILLHKENAILGQSKFFDSSFLGDPERKSKIFDDLKQNKIGIKELKEMCKEPEDFACAYKILATNSCRKTKNIIPLKSLKKLVALYKKGNLKENFEQILNSLPQANITVLCSLFYTLFCSCKLQPKEFQNLQIKMFLCKTLNHELFEKMLTEVQLQLDFEQAIIEVYNCIKERYIEPNLKT